jgi:hypothetical protein
MLYHEPAAVIAEVDGAFQDLTTSVSTITLDDIHNHAPNSSPDRERIYNPNDITTAELVHRVKDLHLMQQL